MNDIDLPKISSLISQKLNKTVEVVGIEKVGSGYHSDGFKLTTDDGHNFFLKKVKSHDLGFEIPERKVFSLLVSDGMYRRFDTHPKTIGIILANENEVIMLPKVDDKTTVYQIQEFEPEGKSYWSLLQDRKEKKDVDENDLVEIENITDFAVSIHKLKHPSTDQERLKSVYNDSLRSVLTNPELMLMMLHDFTDSDPILPVREHGNYIGLMLKLMHKYKDRTDRLTALHGDFSVLNVFVRKDSTIWAIDYSRVPWGDHGLDIGWFLAPYLLLYHETRNIYFKNLAEKFLDSYEAKSGDKEIRQAVSLVLGLLGIIYVWPRFYSSRDVNISRRFFNNILEILKNGQFVWTD